jgi:hypothetical protein
MPGAKNRGGSIDEILSSSKRRWPSAVADPKWSSTSHQARPSNPARESPVAKPDAVRPMMRKQASSPAQNLVSIRVPKKLAGKKLVLVDAAEYAALKRRLAEISDALEKISRGDAAYRQGRTKTVFSLSELGR